MRIFFVYQRLTRWDMYAVLQNCNKFRKSLSAFTTIKPLGGLSSLCRLRTSSLIFESLCTGCYRLINKGLMRPTGIAHEAPTKLCLSISRKPDTWRPSILRLIVKLSSIVLEMFLLPWRLITTFLILIVNSYASQASLYISSLECCINAAIWDMASWEGVYMRKWELIVSRGWLSHSRDY